MKQRAVLLALLLSVCWMTGWALAQEVTQLRLSLSRDFGTAFGGRIRGTFSFRVEGSESLDHVVFLVDGDPIGEDSEAPWRLQFRTEIYGDGIHTLSAIGYTASGQELYSNEIQREFLSKGQTSQYVTILVVVLGVLIVGGRILTSRIANRGQGEKNQPAISGFLGGTVCPKCGRPYALHVWGINLLTSRLDRCPHCGKWALVRRASPQALQTAAELLDEKAPTSPASTSLSEEEKLRRDLEDSRFDDTP